jgi:hypothetical protein
MGVKYQESIRRDKQGQLSCIREHLSLENFEQCK